MSLGLRKRKFLYYAVFLSIQLFIFPFTSSAIASNKDSLIIKPAYEVIQRLIGNRAATIRFVVTGEEGNDRFSVNANNGVLTIKANSSVAFCRGFYIYLREVYHGMVSWSGSYIPLTDKWKDCNNLTAASPYEHRYYLNVVTFGYTTPYWDWARWEKEIDWMALHGVNMPLALMAQEAIEKRVWTKLGLKSKDLDDYFTGPAYLPWHRMGNLNGWSGTLSDSWHKKQIELEHKVLNRMKELGFNPILPAFSGFVPKAFIDKYKVKVNQLSWGGFPGENNAFVISPSSDWFVKLGKMFTEEWENEFGKGKYYLSDTFNEMDVPVPEKGGQEAKNKVLADYSKAIYNSVTAGNKDAVWVTQGWTFGYQHKFWDQASLKAMLDAVPDDKMMIIDLACEYPDYVWFIDPVWKTHEGFYGKDWIYSFVPNFGGKNVWTGLAKFYATNPATALNSPYRKTLKGFGYAPEGIENNELIYELLADVAWTDKPVDTDTWISDFATSRYGGCSSVMRASLNELLQSSYNTFGSYPRFLWQTCLLDKKRKGKVNDEPKFMDAVEKFLSCSDYYSKSELYRNDALLLSALYLGIKADNYYSVALMAKKNKDAALLKSSFEETKKILLFTDKLLASHPSDRLSVWVQYARNMGTTATEKMEFEKDAKRLITSWGGAQTDYAARMWNGLISSYYIPRMETYLFKQENGLEEFDKQWLNTEYRNDAEPFEDPLREAKQWITRYQFPERN